MTTRPEECVAEDSLDALLALPDSDPRRAHVRSCPRCRALVEGYRQFVTPSPEEAAAYGTEEASRLDRFRVAHVEGGAPAGDAVVRTASPGPAGPAAPAGPPARRGFSVLLRPAWGLAALAIVAGAIWFGPRLGRSPEAPVLRGGPDVRFSNRGALPLADGRVRFEWSVHPDADHYELRFYSTELTEIARRNAGTSTSVELGASDLPQAYSAGELIFFRIVAMRGEDDLEMSPPGSLQEH